jgi:hypothetical protein
LSKLLRSLNPSDLIYSAREIFQNFVEEVNTNLYIFSPTKRDQDRLVRIESVND